MGISSGIGEALFPKIRRKVLALFLLNSDKHFYFRETVRLLGDTPGSLHRELKSLTEVGILTMEPIGIQKFYRANTNCPVFNELKSIAERTFGIVDVFKDVFRNQGKERIELAWIYGSIANAQDTSSSDIDIMVVGSLPFRELVSILKSIEENMHRPVNPTLYSPEEFRAKVHEKNNFLRNVMESEKLFILGTKDELARLVK
ncbi:MAG: nucleotidyltransferase domain-containing protein [candidate division Zixibacteria bacterium]|nr:nucleotidyltransferase domain-containing protein [candidate division Zixibacteria bacterium]